MAEGRCPGCAESGSVVATPTGFSQMSDLSLRLSSQGKTRCSSLQPVMLRMVDDFLILTPSRAAAEAVILRTMQGAVRPSGCLGGLSTSLAPRHGPSPARYQMRALCVRCSLAE